MRRNIVHAGAGALTYAIREIVEVAHRFGDLGMEIVWETSAIPSRRAR